MFPATAEAGGSAGAVSAWLCIRVAGATAGGDLRKDNPHLSLPAGGLRGAYDPA